METRWRQMDWKAMQCNASIAMRESEERPVVAGSLLPPAGLCIPLFVERTQSHRHRSPGLAGGDVFHRGSLGGGMAPPRVPDPHPGTPAELIAGVVGKKCFHPGIPEIGGPILAANRKDDGIRQADSVREDPALEVAEEGRPVRNVKGIVRECLHNPRPGHAVIGPSRVGVELLVLGNKGLLQDFSAGKVGSGAVLKRPDLGFVDLHHLVDKAALVPFGNELDGFLHRFEVSLEKACLERAPRLEPLADALLSGPVSRGIAALGDPAETPRGEGVVEIVRGECCFRGIVDASSLAGVDIRFLLLFPLLLLG